MNERCSLLAGYVPHPFVRRTNYQGSNLWRLASISVAEIDRSAKVWSLFLQSYPNRCHRFESYFLSQTKKPKGLTKSHDRLALHNRYLSSTHFRGIQPHSIENEHL